MIKKAVVEKGKSPCVDTGKPCTQIKGGEPCITKTASEIRNINTLSIDIEDRKKLQ